MVLREIRSSMATRLRNPAAWAIFLLLWTAQVTFVGSWPRLGDPLVAWLRLFPPMALFGWGVWIAPSLWQWNGRPQRMPSFHQGLTQALAATSLWVFLLVVVQWAWSKRIGIDISLDAWLKDHVVDTIVVALLGNVVAWRDHEIAEKLKAQTQAIETRNRLLHSQLHPHVLFNALTGLSELTLHDPARAADGMKSLATLLRRLLDLGGQDLFRLQEEQEIVRCYLSIETLRLGDRLKVEWDWEESINHLEVIPLLLQPLVENAIKHGIAPCIQGGMLRISAHRIQGELVMEVANTGAPYTPTRNPRGIGLLNLESRLKSTYGDQARLQMYTQESWTIARISILAALLG